MGDARRILITGATGFVGTHLRALLARVRPGWEIAGTTLHNASTDPGLVPCDLEDAEAIAALMTRVQPEAVIHLAAQSNVRLSFERQEETIASNVLGTLHLLDACRAVVPRARVLVVSSSEVYGPVPRDEQPITEDRTPHPVSPYAMSKATQEMVALRYHPATHLDVVVARPFNHIGPGQREGFVVSDFARQIVEVEMGRRAALWVGNLNAARDFTDVRDVCRAYLLLIEHGVRGGIYNIGQGTPTRIGALLDLLRQIAAVKVPVERDVTKMRPSDAPLMYGDTARIKAEVGWQPEIPLQQSLQETLDWWRAELAATERNQVGGGGL